MIYFAKEDIMTKCNGCGIILQDKNENKEGYTPKLESMFCERCFRIRNYNEYTSISKTSEDFTNILNKIEKSNDLVLLLVDILNLDLAFNLKLKNNVILVITKRDIMPMKIKDSKFLNLNPNLNVVDKLIISSNKNYNLDLLLSKIKKHQKSKNVFVVGFTNAGKSTLINKMIKNYGKNNYNLTVSSLPSTTLDLLEIEINDKLTIIDTPGLIEEGSAVNILKPEKMKMIIPVNEIKPRIFQVKVPQSIIVDEIFRIDTKDNNLTFYVSNKLNIERKYKDTDILKKITKKTLFVNENEDIVIRGIGFIKARKKEKVDIYIDERINVYTRKSYL
jgi:hypothetical protein